MKKLLASLIRAAAIAAVYVAVGTLVAQLLVFAYVWKLWRLDGEKISQMAIVARSSDMVVVAREQLRRQEETPPEQPSFSEIVEARAVKYRNLELREQSLGAGLGQLNFEQSRCDGEMARLAQAREEFEKKLRELKEFEEGEGLQENIVMLQNMKPEQAKEQLIRIYEAGQTDQVVMLVEGMDPNKMKKISAAFNTPEDNKILADVMQRIRLGTPVALLAEQTLDELQADKKKQK